MPIHPTPSKRSFLFTFWVVISLGLCLSQNTTISSCNYSVYQAGECKLDVDICGLDETKLETPQDQYEILFIFPDGQYDVAVVDQNTLAGNQCITISVCVGDQTQPPLRIEVTRKDKTGDDDDLEMIQVVCQPNPSSSCASYCTENVNMNNKTLRVTQTRPLKVDKHTSFIITNLQDSCLDTQIEILYDAAMLRLGGDEDGFQIPEVDLPDVGIGCYSISQQSPGSLILSVTKCMDEGLCCDGNLENIFVNFTGLQEGFTSITVNKYCCEPPPCALEESIVLSELDVRGDDDPYDPNIKFVGLVETDTKTQDWIANNNAQTLYYQIHFQNTGVGATDKIIIKDALDNLLNPSTFTMTYARLGYQEIDETTFQSAGISSTGKFSDCSGPEFVSSPIGTMPNLFNFDFCYDRIGKNVTWVFQWPQSLRGTSNPLYQKDFTYMQTTGEIHFTVETCCFEEYNKQISNEAYITFEDKTTTMPPVKTTQAIVDKVCCAYVVNYDANNPNNIIDVSALVNSQTSLTGTATLNSQKSPNSLIEVSPSLLFQNSSPINLEYQFRPAYNSITNSFEGVDSVWFEICNSTSTVCDTILIPICVNMGPQALPCDTTPCPQPFPQNIPFWPFSGIFAGLLLLIISIGIILRRRRR